MSGVSVTYDDREVLAALRRLSDRVGHLRHAMEGIGQVLQTRTDLCFMTQSDPWGDPWEELSDVTLARRREGPNGGPEAQILTDTGILKNSINAQASENELLFGTSMEYAATHQFGRADNRFYNTPKGAHAPIPARPFLPIRNNGVDLPSDDRDDIMDILIRALEQEV